MVTELRKLGLSKVELFQIANVVPEQEVELNLVRQE